MSKVPSLILVCAAAVLLAACTAVQKGETVVKYSKGATPIMSEATQEANYALYAQHDATPLNTVHLKQGDKLGFERSDSGQLFAVAGDQRIALENGGYYWRRR